MAEESEDRTGGEAGAGDGKRREGLTPGASPKGRGEELGGRPATLDEVKRRKLLAILSNGSSRRVAAHVVGCSPSTITRTAKRDREFAAALVAAEMNVEIEALQHIRQAAKEGRYWRSSAWLLERRNPVDFGRRTPNTVSEEDAATQSS
jgi:hypothetical protein